jgi:poly(3-hydroxybutyrate) depolymerase
MIDLRNRFKASSAMFYLRYLINAVTFASLIFTLGASTQAAERLGSYPIDPKQVSVAGISSGAFMANQLHIAHSADIMGAAMIAGGLYGCAVVAVEDNGVRALGSQALSDCMTLPSNLNEPSAYADRIKEFAARGWIDPTSNLARSRIYFFTGGSDSVVASKIVETGKATYDALGVPAENVVFEDRTGPAAYAGHSWVTTGFPEACDANDSPYLDNCSYDQAGAELKAIYGRDLKSPAGAASGRIVAFDQTEFVQGKAAAVSSNAAANGLSDTGYVYVPKDCEPGGPQRCRLQIVLHGCKQSAEVLRPRDLFYTNIGVNEWADANEIVVLYPQAHATKPEELPPDLLMNFLYANPDGCWNWWGYSDDPLYLTKNGVQVRAIWEMIQRIEGK